MDEALTIARRRLAVLNAIGVRLSRERDPRALRQAIVEAAMELTGAEGASLYEVDPDAGLIRFGIVLNRRLGLRHGVDGAPKAPFRPIPLRLDGADNHSSVVAHCVLAGETVVIPDAYDAAGYDFSGTRAFDAQTGYRSRSFLTVPMRDHEQVITGVLQLINAPGGFDADDTALVESLASQCATAISQRELIRGMHELFEAFIRLIANAIDGKSKHTGGHCRRVPELTMLLAEAAHRTDRGPLADFRMSDADRHELRTAAWLHDCGKITTPEWVVDKATKLSGLGDRIELVAARAAAMLAVAPEGEHAAIRDDLAFLRACNIGGEAMADADIARVQRIAQRRWRDSDGQERPWLDAQEIRCLSIRRGTLLDEERAIINHHIIATIEMLEALPYPRHLRRIPEYAGAHHERMDGRGYPRGLRREQMSVPARIMAIADIFEALTAGDRPYKKAYTLTQALAILGRMKLDGHIDPDLFDVFIAQGVWRDYADGYLSPAQRTPVDWSAVPGVISPPS